MRELAAGERLSSNTRDSWEPGRQVGDRERARRQGEAQLQYRDGPDNAHIQERPPARKGFRGNISNCMTGNNQQDWYVHGRRMQL